MTFSQDDVVFKYTRAEAVMDGVQVELSEKFPDACSGLKAPVFCTAKVWELIDSSVKNPETFKDHKGVIRDICFMSIHAPGRKAIANNTGVEFTVIVTGASITPDGYEGSNPLYRLHALCGPFDFDDPSPTITIAFPDEN